MRSSKFCQFLNGPMGSELMTRQSLQMTSSIPPALVWFSWKWVTVYLPLGCHGKIVCVLLKTRMSLEETPVFIAPLWSSGNFAHTGTEVSVWRFSLELHWDLSRHKYFVPKPGLPQHCQSSPSFSLTCLYQGAYFFNAMEPAHFVNHQFSRTVFTSDVPQNHKTILEIPLFPHLIYALLYP